MANAHYWSCFPEDDPAERPLLQVLKNHSVATQVVLADQIGLFEQLKSAKETGTLQEADILVVGGHGLDSLTGFSVRSDRVAWSDLLRCLGRLLRDDALFVFYSCSGGLPGMTFLDEGSGGPMLAFGPLIKPMAGDMADATNAILSAAFPMTIEQGKTIVAQENERARSQNADVYDHAFLRVWWKDGWTWRRFPEEPRGMDVPVGDPIKSRGWPELIWPDS